MVSVMGHEMEHNLDPRTRSAIKTRQQGGTDNYDVETHAYETASDPIYSEEEQQNKKK